MMRFNVTTEVGVVELDVATPAGVRPPDTDHATYVEGPPTRAVVTPGPPLTVTYLREDGSVDRVWIQELGFTERVGVT